MQEKKKNWFRRHWIISIILGIIILKLIGIDVIILGLIVIVILGLREMWIGFGFKQLRHKYKENLKKHEKNGK